MDSSVTSSLCLAGRKDGITVISYQFLDWILVAFKFVEFLRDASSLKTDVNHTAINVWWRARLSQRCCL